MVWVFFGCSYGNFEKKMNKHLFIFSSEESVRSQGKFLGTRHFSNWKLKHNKWVSSSGVSKGFLTFQVTPNTPQLALMNHHCNWKLKLWFNRFTFQFHASRISGVYIFKTPFIISFFSSHCARNESAYTTDEFAGEWWGKDHLSIIWVVDIKLRSRVESQKFSVWWSFGSSACSKVRVIKILHHARSWASFRKLPSRRRMLCGVHENELKTHQVMQWLKQLWFVLHFHVSKQEIIHRIAVFCGGQNWWP